MEARWRPFPSELRPRPKTSKQTEESLPLLSYIPESTHLKASSSGKTLELLMNTHAPARTVILRIRVILPRSIMVPIRTTIGQATVCMQPALGSADATRLVRAREGELRLLRSALQGSAPSCVLAIVSYSGHFRVLLQFLLSYSVNVLDPSVCGLLIMVSTPTETVSLHALLKTPEYAHRLAAVLPQLHVVDFPATVQQLSPGTRATLPAAKNRGVNGRLYVCAKKAYAVRYAHETLNASHVVVTDSEAYVWKPLSIASIFADAEANPTIWFADAPALVSGALGGRGGARAYGDLPAPLDAKWCSMHVYRDARGLTRQEMLARVPSMTATLFEYMLFSYPRREFRAYWAAVEAAWKRPLFDAVIAAYDAEPRCVAIGFWLEVSWHLFLYEHHRPRIAFRNGTAAIEASFGSNFVRQSSYVHARLELLWRAVSNKTVGSFRHFYTAQPFPLFRYEHRAKGFCLPVQLLGDLPDGVASLQVNSAVPNWVFSTCLSELARLRHQTYGATTTRQMPLPWVHHNTKTRR